LGSLRINTLAIKCDKLSDNYKFCYRAVRTSLLIKQFIFIESHKALFRH
jgi:hypothetical protein